MKTCTKCGHEFNNNGLPAHQARCDGLGKIKGRIKVHQCPYCDVVFERGHVLGAHMTHCDKNPHIEKIRLARSAAGLLRRGSTMSDETKAKISETQSRNADTIGGGYPNVPYYRISNIDGTEYAVRGGFEFDLAEYLNNRRILWIRQVYLKYMSESGAVKTYAPDFYIPSQNLYIEVKGHYSDDNKEKMRRVLASNPGIQLIMIFRKDLDALLSGDSLLEDLIDHRLNIV